MKSVLTLLCIILISFSCRISESTFSDGKKWIPADYSINTGTLLIEPFPGKERWNQDMEKFLSTHYSGKYVVIGETEARSNKYSDLSDYPFLFKWKMGYTMSGGYIHKDPDGYFVDRKTGKIYPTTRKYNNYGNHSYMPFFNTMVKVSKSRSESSVTKH